MKRICSVLIILVLLISLFGAAAEFLLLPLDDFVITLTQPPTQTPPPGGGTWGQVEDPEDFSTAPPDLIFGDFLLISPTQFPAEGTDFEIASPKPEFQLPNLQDYPITTATPKPTVFIPDQPDLPDPEVPAMPFPDQPDIPNPEIPALPFPMPMPEPADELKKSDGGRLMNNEGPPFLCFRLDLTDKPLMFTPMDLSMDGDYHFPLIGDASKVVGDTKVVVRSGVVIVTYTLVNGVKLDTKDEFFTFFPDIRDIPSVDPADLKGVKLKFGMPYHVTNWLNSDPKVLLYINCLVSYKSSLPGLTPFSFQDPDYISRIVQLIPLMD